MYSLLIDTHDKNVLLVLYKDGKVLDMIDKESNMRHSEITMPSLVELIEKNGLTINNKSYNLLMISLFCNLNSINDFLKQSFKSTSVKFCP